MTSGYDEPRNRRAIARCELMNGINRSGRLSRQVNRARRFAPVRWSVALALLGLAACDGGNFGMPAAPSAATSAAKPEVSWASAALARNPNLEVLATDSNAGVFTVRIKSTGEVRAVRLADLAASPITELARAKEQPTERVNEVANTAPATESVPDPQLAANTPPPRPAIAEIRREDGSMVLTPLTPAPAPAGAAPQNTDPANYTIERNGGRIKVSGPGVSIVSSGPASATGRRGAGERNAEPVICDGSRMLHLDNRVITASGNGVIARGGCELYITNSTITAGGTAVIVGDAVVHIANSTIEGTTASFDADNRARMFVRSSNFKGVPRRDAQAVVQDQGGNQWR